MRTAQQREVIRERCQSIRERLPKADKRPSNDGQVVSVYVPKFDYMTAAQRSRIVNQAAEKAKAEYGPDTICRVYDVASLGFRWGLTGKGRS